MSAVAVTLAARANRTAQASLERDVARERSDIVRQVQAWWVTWKEESSGRERDCFGVVVSNTSAGATLLRKVQIETTGNALAAHSRDGRITFETMPPGLYLVQSLSKRDSNGLAWGHKRVIVDMAQYTPLVEARGWSVTRLAFTDPLGARWEWTPDGGLREGFRGEALARATGRPL
jgi:hypothetical protein